MQDRKYQNIYIFYKIKQLKFNMVETFKYIYTKLYSGFAERLMKYFDDQISSC